MTEPAQIPAASDQPFSAIEVINDLTQQLAVATQAASLASARSTYAHQQIAERDEKIAKLQAQIDADKPKTAPLEGTVE